MTRKQRRLTMLFFFALGIGIAASLSAIAFKDTLVFFYSPSDIAANGTRPGETFRLGGMVEKNSVHHAGDNVTFIVTDFKKTTPVTYTGILPDLFREGQGVVAQGKLENDGVFHASTILAKHDERYMPPEVAKELGVQGNQHHETDTLVEEKKMRATLIFLMLIFCPTLAMAGDLSISDIQVIDLKDGPNTIPDFVPNGEEGMIVRGYRSNGNAHGYNVYMVMVPGKSKSSWLVVDTEQALKIDLPLDTLRDDPLTHENNAESVWFAKGKVDRKAASILLIAHRDLSHASNLYEAVATEIQIFILRDQANSVGSTPFIFAQINDRLTTKKYQNTECALANELKLPVPTTVEIDCSTDGIQ